MKVYKVEDIKQEDRGFFYPEHRTTSKDSEGKVAVGEWKATRAEAEQSSRERLSSEPAKK